MLRVASFDNLNVALTTTKLTTTDATKPPPTAINVHARRAVLTRRGATVHRRQVFGDVVGTVSVPAAVSSGAELAQRPAVAGLTSTREPVQTVNTDCVVETRSTQSLTVIHVHVTSTSAVAHCADAPESVALIDTTTCVANRTEQQMKRRHLTFCCYV